MLQRKSGDLIGILVTLLCLVVGTACGQPLAFPGAEGFGAIASGGRGGEVYYVTHLGDDGPGSLRDAVRQSDRMVLFKVSGTIDLKSPLAVRASNITIAGQTAPGDGICLRGKELLISGDNVIVRFLRLRPGDELGQEHDALTVWGADRVIIDHCSLSWSTDSLNDVVRSSTNVTVQWCFLSEPLNRSVHAKGAHGYGTGWGSGTTRGGSFHHNLLAHCNSRSPRLGSEQHALLDVRNNAIYNIGSGWAYGGEHARVNYVGNYYRPGPNTARPREIFRFSSPATRMYLADNVVEGQPSVSENNVAGLAADPGKGMDIPAILVAEPFEVPPIETTAAAEACELVLEHGGATLPRRDSVDRRIVEEVRTGTGRIVDSPADAGGWPMLATAEPPADSDGDGMPDSWERARNLDPHDPSDGSAAAEFGYTWLEHYLNELAAPAMPASAAAP